MTRGPALTLDRRIERLERSIDNVSTRMDRAADLNAWARWDHLDWILTGLYRQLDILQGCREARDP